MDDKKNAVQNISNGNKFSQFSFFVKALERQ